MTLVDAGPLIAILNRNDPDHEPCTKALKTLTRPLVTTWPAFTEAMYLLGAYGGWPAQELLWGMVDAHHLTIGDLTPDEHAQTAALMKQYRDVPMDLADATLVVLAGRLRHFIMFTLDSDFHVYRPAGRHFDVVPG